MHDGQDVHGCAAHTKYHTVIADAQFAIATKRTTERGAEGLGISSQLLFDRTLDPSPHHGIQFRDILPYHQRVVLDGVHRLPPGVTVRNVLSVSTVTGLGNPLQNGILLQLEGLLNQVEGSCRNRKVTTNRQTLQRLVDVARDREVNPVFTGGHTPKCNTGVTSVKRTNNTKNPEKP